MNYLKHKIFISWGDAEGSSILYKAHIQESHSQSAVNKHMYEHV